MGRPLSFGLASDLRSIRWLAMSHELQPLPSIRQSLLMKSSVTDAVSSVEQYPIVSLRTCSRGNDPCKDFGSAWCRYPRSAKRTYKTRRKVRPPREAEIPFRIRVIAPMSAVNRKELPFRLQNGSLWSQFWQARARSMQLILFGNAPRNEGCRCRSSTRNNCWWRNTIAGCSTGRQLRKSDTLQPSPSIRFS